MRTRWGLGFSILAAWVSLMRFLDAACMGNVLLRTYSECEAKHCVHNVGVACVFYSSAS
jgi:hypothetical protein